MHTLLRFDDVRGTSLTLTPVATPATTPLTPPAVADTGPRHPIAAFYDAMYADARSEEEGEEEAAEEEEGAAINYERSTNYVAASASAATRPRLTLDEAEMTRARRYAPRRSGQTLHQVGVEVEAPRLGSGHFDTDNQLIQAMNAALVGAFKRLKRACDERSDEHAWLWTEPGLTLTLNADQRVVMTLNGQGVEAVALRLPVKLATLLGFRTPFPIVRRTAAATSDFAVDTQRGCHNIYVYLSNIDFQYVGHAKAPLLAVIPVDFGRRGDVGQGAVSFEPLHQAWHRLTASRINTFRVTLRDEHGEIVRWRRGSVIVVIHRRVGVPPINSVTRARDASFSRMAGTRGRRRGGAYYAGRRFQRGSGLLSSLFRYALPAVKSIGRRVAGAATKKAVRRLGQRALRGAVRQGRKAAVRVANDALAGRSVKQSLKKRSSQLVGDLLADVASRSGGGGKKKAIKKRPSKTKR